jgi:hypothetical protein
MENLVRLGRGNWVCDWLTSVGFDGNAQSRERFDYVIAHPGIRIIGEELAVGFNTSLGITLFDKRAGYTDLGTILTGAFDVRGLRIRVMCSLEIVQIFVSCAELHQGHIAVQRLIVAIEVFTERSASLFVFVLGHVSSGEIKAGELTEALPGIVGG